MPVEVAKCLYCDDLIEDLEGITKPPSAQKTSTTLTPNQLKDRMKENTYQVMIGTRWAVADVQGRIPGNSMRETPRYWFRNLPALDENGESNFDYPYGLGFSTEYYLDMKASLTMPPGWQSTWASRTSERACYSRKRTCFTTMAYCLTVSRTR